MIFNSSTQTERYSIIDKSGFKYEFPLRASPGEIVYSGKNISPGISDSFYLLEDGEVPWIIHLDKAKCILLCPKVMF